MNKVDQKTYYKLNESNRLGTVISGALMQDFKRSGGVNYMTYGTSNTSHYFSGSVNISESITASKAIFGTGTTVIDDNISCSGYLQVDGNTTLGNTAADTHTFTGPITASNSISSSGRLYAKSLNTGQGDYELYEMNQNVTNTSNVQFANITTTGNSNLGNASSDTHTFTGEVTASGNISASGIITADSFKFGPASIVRASATDTAFYTLNGARGEIRSHLQSSVAADTGWTLELRNTSIKANSLIVANVIGGSPSIITGSVLTANVIATATASFNFFNTGTIIGDGKAFTASFAIF